jgi:homoserine kinase type II
VENSNFLLETADARYILTVYEKRVQTADLPFFLNLKRHLAARGIACPVPLVQRNGEMIGRIGDKHYAIISFLQGHSVSRPDPVQVQAVGRALAQMHLAAADFDGQRENDLGQDGWRQLYAQMSAAQLEQIDAELPLLISDELSYQAQHDDAHLPRGIIHADLFPNNVFFQGDELSGIIDFYFACEDAYVYELGICLNCWCFERDGSFNVTKAKRLLQGYQSVRPLSDGEKEALPQMARGAALRFLLTRAYDWIHTPEDAMVTRLDPLEYAAKLRFHQQVKSTVIRDPAAGAQ